MLKKLKNHWTVQELVVIGVFAAAAKVLTMFVALAGGGMNPVTLLLKNVIFTTLFVVMLFKVRKTGTMLLFSAVTMLVSMMYMGAGVASLPAMIAAALLGEFFIFAAGGPGKPWAPVIGVAVYDLAFRVVSVFISWLVMRENPALVFMVMPIIGIGYLGALIGLFSGVKAVKELRHAGIVRN